MTKQHEAEHGHVEAVQEAFESQQSIMQKVAELGFAQHAEQLPNLADAFDLEKHKPAPELHSCICCMDERTPCGAHAAGSGMLLSDKDFAEYVRQVNPDSISSHTGCGAAKLYAKAKGLPVDQADQIAKDWAREKAQKLGLKYTHLEVDKPFHYARVCYYDGTGRFNYASVKGLPAGFVVGRKNMTKEASLAEVGVAISIIFGDHGFGPKLLNEQNPFLLVAIGRTPEEARQLETELMEAAKSLGKEVMVDGFVAPE